MVRDPSLCPTLLKSSLLTPPLLFSSPNADLEWKVIYVGSAEDAGYDQELENVMVGPVPVGINKFVLQAPAPSYANIPNQDLIGVTVILVTCSFMEKEFVRIGYYVNNEYSEPYEEGALPDPVDITKLFRNILADQPRVTRFAIDWTGGNAPIGEGADAAAAAVGGEEEGAGADDDDALDLEQMGEGDDEDEDEEDDDDEGDVDLEQDEADDDADISAEGDGEGEGEMEVHHEEESMDVEMMQRVQPALQ